MAQTHQPAPTQLARQVVAEVDEKRFQQTLEELIGIPSPSGAEAAAASWVHEYLRQLGVTNVVHDRYHNVVAHLGQGQARLLLITYLDTMKPDPEMSSPFTPRTVQTRRGPAIAGLGAATAKSSCASMLAALAALIKVFGPEPPFPVTFAAFSRDLHPDEHGIVDLFDLHALPADGAIIGEPTALRAGIGARGYAHLRYRFTGVSHHAGRPDSDQNPVAGAASFVNAAVNSNLLKDPVLGDATMTPIEWQSARRPPQTPATAEVLMDRRLVPGDPPLDAIVNELRVLASEGAPQLQVETVVMRHQFPWLTSLEEPVVRALSMSMQLVSGRELTTYPLPFASAGGHLQNVADIPPVAFAGGDIAAIGAAEHIVIEDGLAAARAMAGAAVLFQSVMQDEETRRSSWRL